MKNTKLNDLFIEMANCPTLEPLYRDTTRILGDATKWSFGWDVLRTGKGWSIILDNILCGGFTIELYLVVQLKKKIAVSLSLMGMALNIEQLGWTGVIPYADLEQNPFHEQIAAVFPHGLKNDTEEEYHSRIREFLKQYPL